MVRERFECNNFCVDQDEDSPKTVMIESDTKSTQRIPTHRVKLRRLDRFFSKLRQQRTFCGHGNGWADPAEQYERDGFHVYGDENSQEGDLGTSTVRCGVIRELSNGSTDSRDCEPLKNARGVTWASSLEEFWDGIQSKSPWAVKNPSKSILKKKLSGATTLLEPNRNGSKDSETTSTETPMRMKFTLRCSGPQASKKRERDHTFSCY